MTFTSASEALARIQTGERYHVILCDLMMPVVTGMELHQRIAGVGFRTRDRVPVPVAADCLRVDREHPMPGGVERGAQGDGVLGVGIDRDGPLRRTGERSLGKPLQPSARRGSLPVVS